MKTKKQIRNNRISILFSLTAILLFPFISNAQLNVISNGNVGIGTTPATSVKLDVLGNIHAINNGTAEQAVFGGSTNTTNSDVLINSAAAYQSLLAFQSAGTTESVIYRPGGSTDLRFNTPTAGDAMTITQAGHVGIGTTGPGYLLELSVNSAAKPTSSTWAITSDKKTKTNVESYIHGLDLVRQVKLISYQYNGLAHTPKGEHGIGVIAQDFQNVFPNSVKPFTIKNDSTKTEETFLGVDLHELFVSNVGAVQQLDSIVSAQNTALKDKVDGLTTIATKQDSTIKAMNTTMQDLQNQLTQLSNTISSCCTATNTNGAKSLEVIQTNVELTNS